jgi:hypothetical protein
MITRITLRVIASLFISIFCNFVLCPASNAESEEPGESIVKSESLIVHSEISEKSEIVKQLKKGDIVIVELEITGETEWCGIRQKGQKMLLGYVPCHYLERQEISKSEGKSAGTESVSKAKPLRSERPISIREKKNRPYSDITVILYMTSW